MPRDHDERFDRLLKAMSEGEPHKAQKRPPEPKKPSEDPRQ